MGELLETIASKLSRVLSAAAGVTQMDRLATLKFCHTRYPRSAYQEGSVVVCTSAADCDGKLHDQEKPSVSCTQARKRDICALPNSPRCARRETPPTVSWRIYLFVSDDGKGWGSKMGTGAMAPRDGLQDRNRKCVSEDGCRSNYDQGSNVKWERNYLSGGIEDGGKRDDWEV